MIGQLLTGRYLILETLGAGGFSETYLARDKYLPHHPLCVVKCFKMPSSSTLSLEEAQRFFETEARLLEQLGQHHAQIPTLFAYCHEQDHLYLVQEYIEGKHLGEALAQGTRLSAAAAIDLLLEVLPVLEYIHSHRVIHRDIKPSHLIRRKRDNKVVLIDFGAACLLPETDTNTQPESEDTPLAIGTPGYMPDEQHLGMAQLNSDLYALGIVVIQLMTGVNPRQFQPDLISGELDWQLYLRDQSIDPSLIAILNRMMRSRFSDRYQQAADVIADLKALPAAKRFSRKGNGRWQGLGNWRKVERRIAIPAAALLLLGLFGGRYAYEHKQSLGAAIDRLQQQVQPPAVQLTMLHDVPAQSGVSRMLIAPNNRRLITVGNDHTLQLRSLPDGAVVKSLSGHTAAVTVLAVSPDSRLLASGGEDRVVRLWDLESGQFLRAFNGHQMAITAMVISPDGQTLVSASQDGVLRQWDMQTGTLLNVMNVSDGAVTAVAYGPTPNSLITASNDRQIQIWDLQTRQLHRRFAGHTAPIVGLEVENNHIFSFGKDRGLMWNLNREELEQVLPKESANPRTVSCYKQHLMTVHDNGSLRLWVRKAGQFVMRKAGELGRNTDVVLSPDHHYLVSWSPDQRLRIWQIAEKAN